ncbi:MAG: molybdopterin converting factor subunit 1 [Hydrogenophaga sp.]|uniref:molybdopterin converting factor subunit 1 n=1 Tax=Hydrogenophaga sp. TaxID=1904254 RepID=UPI003D146067
MKVQLRYFASLRETLGKGAESVDTQATTLGALRAELVARGGAYAEALALGKSVRVALNQTMSEESAVVSEGAEVGFFPPVTGG